jgi:NADPH:quinone reductase
MQALTQMKAVTVNLDYSAGDFGAGAFLDEQLAIPPLKPNDLRVKVMAVAINPIDLRMGRGAKNPGQILGWDVAGVVESVGAQVSLFQVGDAVYYAGAVNRPGGLSEYHVVDENIVGKKPSSLSFTQAAALPLAAITSWEALFEKMGITQQKNNPATLLILGGAGGVGSMAIQLACKLAGMTVVASASRPQSHEYCLQMGASHVVNHSDPITPQLKALGLKGVDYVLCMTNPAPIFADLADLILPLGKICSLVESSENLPMNLLRNKGISFSWEGAFTRSLFKTRDIQMQHHILQQVSEAVDQGILQTTLQHDLGKICADKVGHACRMLQAGGVVGKIVMCGW